MYCDWFTVGMHRKLSLDSPLTYVAFCDREGQNWITGWLEKPHTFFLGTKDFMVKDLWAPCNFS